MRVFEVEGESPEVIVSQFIKEQNIPSEYIEYDIIEAGSKGLFGIGKKNAKIKIKYNDSEHIKRKSRMMLSDLLEKAGFTDVHITTDIKNNKILLNIESDYTELLIGKQAQTLDAIQYLLDKMIKLDENSDLIVNVDVASYRQRTVEKHLEKALSLAEHVKKTGKSIKLPPMTTMIRKEIHIALKNISGITTISSGEGQIKQICIVCEKKGNPTNRRRFNNNRKPRNFRNSQG